MALKIQIKSPMEYFNLEVYFYHPFYVKKSMALKIQIESTMENALAFSISSCENLMLMINRQN